MFNCLCLRITWCFRAFSLRVHKKSLAVRACSEVTSGPDERRDGFTSHSYCRYTNH